MRLAYLDLPPVLSLTRRTAVYGPVCTVVWEGWAGNRSPYPDLLSFTLSSEVAERAGDLRPPNTQVKRQQA